MELFSKKRRGIYVYFRNTKDINKLEKYGNVISYSNRYKYIYLYVSEEKSDDIVEEISQKKFVKNVIKSELVDLNLEFISQ